MKKLISFIIFNTILLGLTMSVNAQTVLFTEDFESYSTSTNLPSSGTNVWIQYLLGDNNNPWGIGGNTGGQINGSRSLTIHRNNGTPYAYGRNRRTERVAFYSEMIDASLYGNLKLSFNWKCDGENNWDYGRVVWSSDGVNWTDVNATNYQNAASTQTVTDLDLSALNEQQFYLGFSWLNDNNTGSNPGFVIDDIQLTGVEIPTDYGNSPGLVYWLRGDLNVTGGTPVTAWGDISGNANDANDDPNGSGPDQVTSVDMNNQEVMSFNGSTAFTLANDARINASTANERTMFIAFRTGADVSSGTAQYIYEQGGGTRGIGVYIKNDKLYVITYASNGSDRMIVSQGVSSNTSYVLSFIWNTGTLTAKLNNTSFSNQSSSGSTPSLTSHTGDVTIGRVGDGTRNENGASVGAGANFSGQIAEILYYDKALAELEEVEINNDLAARYSISASLDYDIYYSYQSGDWDNHTTWTHDPGGTTQTATDVPGQGDHVVILSTRDVTLTDDVDTANLELTIKDGGVLDMSTYQFTSNIRALHGQGTLKLASVNYPTVTTNEFVLDGGGTTEYNNATNFTLPVAQSEYYNLRINASGVTATQLSDITLNGDLHVKQGTYRINDGSANRRQLTIDGDLLVDNGASLTIGNGNTQSGDISGATTAAPFVDYYDLNSHRIVLYGDFTNNGTVKFTNQSYPVYNAFPTNGMATVYFMGATNNTLKANGTTDLYNLVLDKGIDQTYKLTVYSSAYQNFRLFGRNNLGGENGGDNPDLRKALWVRTGTLELTGLTVIPSLVEGTDCGSDPNSDYYIPGNGAIQINGTEVIVLSTADSYQEINLAYGVSAPNNSSCGVATGSCTSFSILGRLQVDNGYFSTRESGGIITWDDASGELIINGGTIDVKQYRSAGSSGGLASFSQSGGTFLLRGRFQRTPTAYSSIANLKDFSTATLNTTRVTGGLNGSLGTFNINETANVFSMSGGTIRIYDVCGTSQNEAFEVYSADANNSVTGGTVEIVPTTGSGTDATQFIIKSTADLGNLTINRASSSATVDINTYDLTVLNDLTITAGELDANSLDVNIGGDFVIENGAVYTTGTNWTIFNGTGAQNFEVNTVPVLGIKKMKIDKPVGTTLTLAGTQAKIAVQDSLMLIDGNLDDGGKMLELWASGTTTTSYVYNSGVHTGSGKIMLSDDDPQVIDGDGTGIFENLELNNTDALDAPISLDSDITINGELTFSQDKLFDINTHNLSFGASATVNNAGSNRFIQTAANAGDGGVSKTYSASNDNFTFPLGAPTLSPVQAVKYTPANIEINGSATNYGTITVVPVGYEHPNTTNKGRSLTYFWRTKSEGFNLGAATVNHSYNYSNNDLVDNGTTITENEYIAAKYDNSSYTWTKYAASDVIEGANIIGGTGTAFATLNYIDGEFTAGDDNAIDPFGTPVVYYSRQTGLWTDNNTWTFNDTHSGASAGSIPGASDIVIIGGQDSVYLSTNLTTPNTGDQSAATLKIERGSALDIGYNYDCNFAVVLNHENGNGNFRLTTSRSSGSTFTFPSGDFSDYNINLGTTEFYTTNPNPNTTYWLPNGTIEYGNLIISPKGGSNLIFPNHDLLIYGNLITRGQNSESWFCPNWRARNYPTAPTVPIAKTITVLGDFNIQGGALIWYNRNNTGAQDFVVEGDLILNTDAGIKVFTNGSGNSQKITIGGSLINNSITPGGSPNQFRGCDFTNIPLIFNGDGVNYITNDDPTDNTYSIIESMQVNKGSSQSDSLIVDITGTFNTPTNDWLTLVNGTFHYEHNDDLTITTTSPFTIPSTAGLSINSAGNTVYLANANSNDNDVYLNGKLTITDGDVEIGNSANNRNNDIEYSGGGDSEIDIRDGSLFVNGQIRRNPSTSAGVLKYSQSGATSSVIINGRNALTTNAKLEILNSGSQFNMSGGTLTIVRGGGDGTFGDLYLRPENSTVTGGEIIFEPGAAGSQDFIFDANVPIWDLTIEANANVELLVSPLQVDGDLTLTTATTSILDANPNFNIPITINGNFDNSGVYTHRNNLTTFSGVTQQILGSSAIDFYDLTVNSLIKLTLNGDANVKNDLILSRGTLECDVNTVYVQGNVSNNATYTDSNTGIVLNGSVQQLIDGTGTWGQLEIDNDQGARTEDNITLQKNLILTKGILDINNKLLTLGTSSDIMGAPFDNTKMIASDGVFSNVGLRKYFDVYSGADQTFTFPIGTSGKYTPAVLTYSDIGNLGYIRINNINDNHPGVIDPTNVLDYYWEVESDAITGFNGSLVFNYLEEDVQITGVNAEADYIAASLLLPGTSWTKVDAVDESANTVTFNYVASGSLSGEYTAGIDAALPNQVPEFTSINDGDWSDPTNWNQTSGDLFTLTGGPNGFIVVIDSDDVITTDVDYASAYRITIDGTLRVVSPTFGHNLGTVSGSGTLYLESGTFPAGRYTNFLDCSNNATLQYGGNTDYNLIADLYSTIPNLHFIGTGNRVLPNKDLTICNQLLIDGPTLDNSVNNKKLSIQGTIERYNTGAFVSGTGSGATVSLEGSAAQNIGGALGDFTGSNAFNNFEINNSLGLTINNSGNIEVKGDLLLTSGNIITSSSNILKISNTEVNSVIPLGGSSASYVDGPLVKTINQGDNFVFPIGKGAELGNKVELSSIQSGTIDWTVEFFTPNSTYTSFAAPLTYVNSKEYWTVSAPSGSQAYVGLDWDASSDLTPLMTQNGVSDMRVAYDNAGTWTQIASTGSGSNTSGTVTTSSRVSIPASGDADFTTSCINVTKPRARLNPVGAICGDVGIPVTFTGSTLAYNYILTYKKGGVLQAPVTITSADIPYILPTDAIGTTYQLISFTYNEPGSSTTGVVDPAIITTYTVPTTAAAGSDQSICGATSASLAANSPTVGSGEWSVVSGAGGSFVDPTNPTTTFNGTNGTTYTLRWTVTNGGCFSTDDVVIAFPLLPVQPGAFTVSSAIVCDGDQNVEYTVANDPSLTYTWDYSGTGESISGTGNSITIDFNTGTTNGTVSVFTTNGCGDSAPLTIDVTVSPVPTANDQTPAAICSESTGDVVTVTGLNLRDHDDAITGSSGDAVSWYSDAGLTTTIADPTDVDISGTFGGATNITKIYYCEVDNGSCTNTATVTYTIYRIPQTGPQYHIENDHGL